jgi:hypothetical protein|tara:strand:+ start:725 stop:1711 length:987 start_codon:yes stop_codon:yes gene_type:complete
MQEQEQEKMVDIDTSGPGIEVELPEEKENENVQTNNDTVNNVDTSDQSVDASSSVEEKTEETKTEETNEEKKKELDDYSDGVKRRIAKLTKKMREAERREEAATLYAKSVLAEQEKLKSRLAKVDTDYVSEMEGRIKSGMEAAVAKLAKAREENNLQAEVAAQAEISRLGYEEARLSDMKVKETTKKEQKPVEQPEEQYVPQRRIDPKAQEWADKNTWFNKDIVMTEGAKAIHRQLVEEEGYDPISNAEEYYQEIDRRIALEFPHKFAKNTEETTNKPTQTVASATRSSKSGRKVQRLTPSEVAIAKKLGVSLDEYAKQKRLMNTEGA